MLFRSPPVLTNVPGLQCVVGILYFVRTGAEVGRTRLSRTAVCLRGPNGARIAESLVSLVTRISTLTKKENQVVRNLSICFRSLPALTYAGLAVRSHRCGRLRRHPLIFRNPAPVSELFERGKKVCKRTFRQASVSVFLYER